MYLKRGTILNSGPIEDIEFIAPFNTDGTPVPTILVGGNGSGKTAFLSIIADALLEIAAQHFQDILPPQGMGGHQFYRVLSGRNQRTSAAFELCALRFEEGTDHIYYRSKIGTLQPAAVSTRMALYPGVSAWDETQSEKFVTGEADVVRRIYASGVYAFFPASRVEIPHWLNAETLSRDPEISLAPRYTNRLSKPIVIETAIASLKPWFADIILDASLDPMTVLESSKPDLDQMVIERMPLVQTLAELNNIIQLILRRPDVRLVRRHRGFREARLTVADANGVIFPSFDNLSAGQAILLAIFGTILRYGQSANVSLTAQNISGLVVIDEIDAHLHAELQHDVLPRLIQLFPRVQFIVSSHSPLFLLGMQKLFGNSFCVLEMPRAVTIDVERFSEFETAFAYFQGTRSYLDAVEQIMARGQSPLVLTEGETDPAYLRTAADILQMANIVSNVDFDWVGRPTAAGAHGGGKTNLAAAFRFLSNNPQFVNRPVLLLFDSDANADDLDKGTLHVRSLKHNPNNTKVTAGIENLLPEDVIEDRFFISSTKKQPNGTRVTTEVLNKTGLCAFLCSERRNSADFENFRDLLQLMSSILLTSGLQPTEKAVPQVN